MTPEGYDLAMLARFKHYFPRTFWVEVEGDLVQEVRNQILLKNPGMDQKELSIFPFLALRRVGIPIGVDDHNFSAIRRGIGVSEKEEDIAFDKYIMRYYLDVVSSDRANFDELVIEVQENLRRSPYLYVKSDDWFFGNQGFKIAFEEMIDNTSLESYRESTRIYRATAVFTIEARIFRHFKVSRVDEFSIKFIVEGDPETVIEDKIS